MLSFSFHSEVQSWAWILMHYSWCTYHSVNRAGKQNKRRVRKHIRGFDFPNWSAWKCQMIVEILPKHFPFWKKAIIFFLTAGTIKIFPIIFIYSISLTFRFTLWGISINFSSQHFLVLINALYSMINMVLDKSGTQISCFKAQTAEWLFFPWHDYASAQLIFFSLSFLSRLYCTYLRVAEKASPRGRQEPDRSMCLGKLCRGSSQICHVSAQFYSP